MSAPPGHVHVSERQSGKWEDCVWMSAVEWLRQVYRRSIPATHAEGDALRLASGDLGFSNFWNLEAGVQVRYGWSLPDPVPAAGLWAALKPGSAAIVVGSLPAWPSGSHWRRWDPGSTADHATFAYRFDATDAVWWCDPLAPTGIGYQGEVMPKAELLRFVGLKSWGQLVAPILEGVMAIYQRRETPGTFTIRAGVEVHGYRPNASGWEVAKTRPKAVVVSLPASFDATLGRLSGTTTPSSLLAISTGYFAGLYVDTAEVDETVNPAPLDATPFSQYDLDAATAALKDKIAAAQAALK